MSLAGQSACGRPSSRIHRTSLSISRLQPDKLYIRSFIHPFMHSLIKLQTECHIAQVGLELTLQLKPTLNL